MPGCDLCSAVAESLSSKLSKVANRILAESNDFLLLPAVGPLVTGHALIISRKHHISLGSMTPDAIEDYEQFVARLRSAPEIEFLLEAEHGPTPTDNAGSCIAHTHINILPGLQCNDAMLSSSIPRAGTLPTALDLQNLSYPYIFFRGEPGNLTIYDASSAPSQAIRRGICSRLGNEDWDWAVFPRVELIQKTIDFWHEIFSNGRAV